MKKIASVVFTCAFIAGCATISHTASITQPTGRELVAGNGDVVAKITTEKSMPNAFGKADIFGRSTPTGQTTVIYEGVKNGQAIFVRRSVDIETGATTMNSTPIVVSNTSSTTTTGNYGNKQFNATSTTTGPSTVIAPNTPEVQRMERNAKVVTVDINKLPASFIVEGYQINVNTADSGSVSYSITKRND